MDPQGAISASSSADAMAHGASMAVDGSSSTFCVRSRIVAVLLSSCLHPCLHMWCVGERIQPPSGLGSDYHSLSAFWHNPNQGPHPCETRNILKALDFLTEIRQGCLQQALVLIISCCPLRLLKNSSSCGGLLPSFVCIPLKRWMPIS